MNQKDKEALYAFVQASLKEKGWQLDESALSKLGDSILLTPAESDLSKEKRQVTFGRESSGQITASSFKFLNIAQISTYDLLGFVGKELGVVAFDDTALKVIYGFAMLIHEFLPTLKVTFSDQEAQVLFAIAQLEEKEFNTKDLYPVYQEAFSSTLTETQMEASLEVLVKHFVIERTAVKEYKIKEKIKNLQRLQ